MVLTSQKARKYATFWYLFIFLRHQTDRLNVFRPREHIHRLALLCPVARMDADDDRQQRYADEDELADAGYEQVDDEEVDASYNDVDEDDEY